MVKTKLSWVYDGQNKTNWVYDGQNKTNWVYDGQNKTKLSIYHNVFAWAKNVQS